MERFFEKIRQFRLRLNPKKYTFGVTSTKLLVYMVSERDIKVDLDKIRVILDMPAPRTEREVGGFLGRLQYISRFIARLTDIYEPIFRLLMKRVNLLFGMISVSVHLRGSESIYCHHQFWYILHQIVPHFYICQFQT